MPFRVADAIFKSAVKNIVIKSNLKVSSFWVVGIMLKDTFSRGEMCNKPEKSQRNTVGIVTNIFENFSKTKQQENVDGAWKIASIRKKFCFFP